MRNEDLDAVFRIWMSSNLDTHTFIASRYWERHAGEVRRILPESEVWVYESGGSIVGFAGLSGDYVAGIFVESNARSQGVGRALLEVLKCGHRFLALHVYEQNHRAMMFYRREGFRAVARQTEADTGEPEWRMEWRPGW